jgi:hypothetical protein
VFLDGTSWYPVSPKKLFAVITKVANPDPHYFEKLYQDPYRVKSWIRIWIRIIVKIKELWRLKREPWRALDPHNRDIEARNGALRVCRTVVAYSHYTLLRNRIQDLDLH